MRRVFLSQAFVCLVLSTSFLFSADTPPAVETISLNEIHAGMKGVAYTVFQGTKPEPMDVEVLGILKNANGPKGDIILVRLGGEKAQYTGVVAGHERKPSLPQWKTSGSPCFPHRRIFKRAHCRRDADRRNAGNQRDGRTPGEGTVEAKSGPAFPEKHPARAWRSACVQFKIILKPIETPLVFNGFSEERSSNSRRNSPPQALSR